MRLAVIAMALMLGGGSASAKAVGGHSALALGAIVGGYSPLVNAEWKAELAELLNGEPIPASKAAKITILAAAVDCRAGDVDIAAFRCDLKFGATSVHLSGRRAHELFATLGDAGVAADGAAGSVRRALSSLRCAIDPAGVARRDGGGADCAYNSGS